jgi:hypothetical protein
VNEISKINCPPDCEFNPNNPNRDQSRTCLAVLAVGVSVDSPTARLAERVLGGDGSIDKEALARVEHCEMMGGESSPTIQVTNIPSIESPFHIQLREVALPDAMTTALTNLYQEFQDTFRLPEGHRENETDYRYCIDNGSPMMAVQIDMAGLTEEELESVGAMPIKEAEEFLRRKIFEIEGSIAGYGILGGMFRDRNGESEWGNNFRQLLDNTREFHQKPIVLLAPTHDKYAGMLGFEFGYTDEEISTGCKPTDEEVKRITGFDSFMGPDEYLNLLRNLAVGEDNLPADHPLLYVRASDPVAKLSDPRLIVDHPLLGDADIRRVIRAFTLTPNVDNPESPLSQHVNDTKSYMADMGLAVNVVSSDDLTAEETREFLIGRGIDTEGEFAVRVKPMNDAYGGYGHLKVRYEKGQPIKKHRNKLTREIDRRGAYVAQPEINTLEVIESTTGALSKGIFRIWLGAGPDGSIHPIGGVVNMIPATSQEVEGRIERIHGNSAATYAKIVL